MFLLTHSGKKVKTSVRLVTERKSMNIEHDVRKWTRIILNSDELCVMNVFTIERTQLRVMNVYTIERTQLL